MISRETGLSPEEGEYVQETIRNIGFDSDPTVYVSAILFLAKLFNKNPIQGMEMVLRQMESPTHFLALPAAFYPEFMTLTPHSKEMCPYGLSICMSGTEEAWDRMEKIKTTPEENFANLAQTGILFAKPGTVYSRIAHAKDN